MRSVLARSASVGLEDAGRDGAIEHAIAGAHARPRCCGPGGASRRLRKRDQERGLAGGEMTRLLAEIGERRGAHAFDVAAERGEAQVEAQDLGLATAALELQRAHHLAQLAAAGALVAAVEQARDLHGQRRAAGHDAAVTREQVAGAREGVEVDAAVLVEALVLEGHQDLRSSADRPRSARAAGASGRPRGEGAQQAILAIEHRDRDGLAASSGSGPMR